MIYENETIFKDKSFSNLTEKRPRLLNILLLVSLIFILTSLVIVTQDLINGPMGQLQLENQISSIYDSNMTHQDINSDYTHSASIIANNAKYFNNEVFYLSNTIMLATLIIGLISLILMFFMIKFGFYTYIIYNALPIITMYLITPQDLLLHTSLVFLMLTSVLCIGLYSVCFKKISTYQSVMHSY